MAELYKFLSLMISSQLYGDYIIFEQGNGTTTKAINILRQSSLIGLNQISIIKSDRMLENAIVLEKIHTFLDSEQKRHETYGIQGLGTIKRRITNTEHDFSLSISKRLNLTGICLEVAHVRKPNAITKSGSETLRNFPNDISYEVFPYAQDLFGFNARFHNVTNWVSSAPPNVTSMADFITSKNADIALTATALFNDSRFRFLLPSTVQTGIPIYYQSNYIPLRGGIYEGLTGKTSLAYSLVGMTGIIILMSFCFYQNTGESTIMWTIGILTGQGVGERTLDYKISTRILAIVIILFEVLSISILSSYLTASLSFTKQITSIQDLTDRGITEFGFEENTFIADTNDTIRAGRPGSIFWNIRKILKSYKNESDALLDLQKNRNVAYIAGLQYESKYCGQFNQLLIDGQKRYGSAFVDTMSKYAEPFNYAGIKMFETGLTRIQRQYDKKRREDAKANCTKFTIFEPHIHFEDIRLIYILMVGIMSAIIGFVIEILRNGIRKQEVSTIP